jgi:hypothetical protein
LEFATLKRGAISLRYISGNPPNLDLDEEGGEHEGEGSAVDDEFLAAYFTRFFLFNRPKILAWSVQE